MKRLVVSGFIIVGVFFGGYLFAGSAFDQAVDTAIESKKKKDDDVNCGPWNKQPNGCYERVCCCDKNGAHYCERCCPDASGKYVASKVKC